MRLSYERRQKVIDFLQTVAGAVILIVLVALAIWAVNASKLGPDTGCSRAYCAEYDGGGDGPDHPDLEDVYDYNPADEADRQQELEDARQEGYEEGQNDGR